MAVCMQSLGNLAQAIVMQTQAIEILRELVHNEPNSVSLHEYLGEAINKLGGFQRGQEKFAGFIRQGARSQTNLQIIARRDPNNSLAKANVAFADNGIADGLVRSGQPAAAIEVLQEALATFQALSPETASNSLRAQRIRFRELPDGQRLCCVAASRRPSRAQASAEWREARSWYQKSLAMWVVKEKRGELESDERSEQQQVLAQITRCDAELQEATNARDLRPLLVAAGQSSVVVSLQLSPASGSSSAVERQLPKLDVAGSIPVSRSTVSNPPRVLRLQKECYEGGHNTLR